MPAQEKGFPIEPDEDEWQRVWGSMQNRRIPDPTALDLPLTEQFGNVVTASISEAPMQYLDYLYFPSDVCPLCSESTSAGVRLPTSLSLTFDLLKAKIGVCAWAHCHCFEKLELSDEPPPIPS